MLTTMSIDAELSDQQDRTWRGLIRLTVVLPRAVDEDLRASSGLTLTNIGILLHLSEAPEARMRMTDLAEYTAMSPSRITRAVQQLVAEGCIEQCTSDRDGRASIAALTDAGRSRLQAAMPGHLATLRSRVLDHIPPAELDLFNDILDRLLDGAGAPVPSVRAVLAT